MHDCSYCTISSVPCSRVVIFSINICFVDIGRFDMTIFCQDFRFIQEKSVLFERMCVCVRGGGERLWRGMWGCERECECVGVWGLSSRYLHRTVSTSMFAQFYNINDGVVIQK